MAGGVARTPSSLNFSLDEESREYSRYEVLTKYNEGRYAAIYIVAKQTCTEYMFLSFCWNAATKTITLALPSTAGRTRFLMKYFRKPFKIRKLLGSNALATYRRAVSRVRVLRQRAASSIGARTSASADRESAPNR